MLIFKQCASVNFLNNATSMPLLQLQQMSTSEDKKKMLEEKFKQIKMKQEKQKQSCNSQPNPPIQGASAQLIPQVLTPIVFMSMASGSDPQPENNSGLEIKSPLSLPNRSHDEKPAKQSKQKQMLDQKIPTNEKQRSQAQLAVEKHGAKYFSESHALAEGQGQQRQKLVKVTRYLLKDIDKIKETVANLEASMKLIEYIQSRASSDKLFHKKIKSKLSLLQKMNETQKVSPFH